MTNAIIPAAIRLRVADIDTGHIDRYDAWQAERNALLAQRAEMERTWAIEDAAWTASRNRLAVATVIDAVLILLTIPALVFGAKWLATLLLIAATPGALVALAAMIWPTGIYPWSRPQPPPDCRQQKEPDQ